MATSKYVTYDSVAYFAKSGNTTYKIIFDKFAGSSTGAIYFRRGEPGSLVADTIVMGTSYANDVYYKISTGASFPVARSTWDIAFSTSNYSSSILINDGTGVGLWAFPKLNLSGWTSVEEVNAKKEIERFDNSRREFIKHYFHADLEDSLHYDLVINTEHFSFEDAASIVINALPFKDKTTHKRRLPL